MAASRRTSESVYQQVANILRSQVVGCTEDRPVRLPTEEELARTHAVSRVTIHRALRVLSQEGLIEQTPGRGTVTVPDGVLAWRRLHKGRKINVISTWSAEPDVPMNFYGQIYQGVLVGGREAGYQVLLEKMGSRFPKMSKAYVKPADPEQTVGVILIGVYGEDIIQMHVDSGYPVVCTDYWTVNSQADAVLFDCFAEGYKVAEFLHSLGHKHLFYIGNCSTDEDRRSRRECDADLMEAGFLRALREVGFATPPYNVLFSTEYEMQQAIEWYLSLRPRPTAGLIFGASGMRNFLEALPEYGLRCPDDVSLVCKAIPGSEPDFAAVRNDPFAMGRFALNLLMERAAGKRNLPVRIAIESTLHRGKTVRNLHA